MPTTLNDSLTTLSTPEADLPIQNIQRGWRTGAIAWIPPLIVFAMLAGIGWCGHHCDWKLSSFGSFASSDGVPVEGWCDSHGVAEDTCIVCDPSLIELPAKLEFCNEHGVHGCVLHHPELAETNLPTAPTKSDLERATRALALMPRLGNLSLAGSAGSRIQFASVDAMNKAGVAVEPALRSELTESIFASGEIQYHATRTAQISPAADGIVRRMIANVGDWVQVGDVLAVVDSQDVGRLKSTLLSALLQEQLTKVQVDRFSQLAPSGAISGKRLLEATTEQQQSTVAVEQAVRAFMNLGLSVDERRLRSSDLEGTRAYVRSIGMSQIESSDSDNLIAVTAPIEGRIVDRATTMGEVIDRGGRMFRIADTRTVWLDLRVPAEQASLAKVGLQVRYQPDGSDKKHRGEVIWISTDVDSQTRTVRVRAELANEDGALRNESFGRGEIILREEADAIMIPEESLQWDGASHVVFVRDARFFEKDRPKFFVTRSVRPGAKQNGKIEIIAGILPGEVVATDGSDVLRAQLLRSKLGAGCTCGH